MNIPSKAKYVTDKLRAAGFEAYPVGGCVRDALLGREPNDWDICSSARPEQLVSVFADDATVATGLKHGTLTVIVGGEAVEVTSYRTEGAYSDCRHPDSVRFVASLREDLARRDFTINAMAWDEAKGLIDPFGGEDDLCRGLIRCVGEPIQRFGEDALRMLRALRFAARFGFAVEEETAEAIHTMKERLNAVSAERIFAELKGIVMGDDAARVLGEFSDVLELLLPGALPFGDDAPGDFSVRMALLAKKTGPSVLGGLRCDRKLKTEVRELLSAGEVKEEKDLWRAALRYGESRALQLGCMYGLSENEVRAALEASPCLSLGDLAVNGEDIKALGLTGAAIGRTLRELAEKVLAGELENEWDLLMVYITHDRQA